MWREAGRGLIPGVLGPAPAWVRGPEECGLCWVVWGSGAPQDGTRASGLLKFWSGRMSHGPGEGGKGGVGPRGGSSVPVPRARPIWQTERLRLEGAEGQQQGLGLGRCLLMGGLWEGPSRLCTSMLQAQGIGKTGRKACVLEFVHRSLR